MFRVEVYTFLLRYRNVSEHHTIAPLCLAFHPASAPPPNETKTVVAPEFRESGYSIYLLDHRVNLKEVPNIYQFCVATWSFYIRFHHTITAQIVCCRDLLTLLQPPTSPPSPPKKQKVHLAGHLRERAKRLRRPPPAESPSPLATAPAPLFPTPRAVPATARTLSRQPEATGRRLGRACRRRFDSPPPPLLPLPPAAPQLPPSPHPHTPLETPERRSAFLFERDGSVGDCVMSSAVADSWGGDVKTAAIRDCTQRADQANTAAGVGARNKAGRARKIDTGGRPQSVRCSLGCGSGVGTGWSGGEGDTCGGLATAVERFASCLEASVCRRGSTSSLPPPPPPAYGDFSVSDDNVAYRYGALNGALSAAEGGSTPTLRPHAWCPASNGGRFTPSELLLALREANGINAEGAGGGGGCDDGGDGTSTADGGLVGRAAVSSRPLLWGLDEDGESVKEVAAYGERNEMDGSSEVRAMLLGCFLYVFHLLSSGVCLTFHQKSTPSTTFFACDSLSYRVLYSLRTYRSISWYRACCDFWSVELFGEFFGSSSGKSMARACGMARRR